MPAPYVQLGAFVALISAALLFRWRCGAAPFSILRLLLAGLLAFLLMVHTLGNFFHKCDFGQPYQSGLIPAIVLAYSVARIRLSEWALTIGVITIFAVSSFLSAHFVQATHTPEYSGRPSSPVAFPVRPLWHTKITGLYAREPFSVSLEKDTRTLIEGVTFVHDEEKLLAIGRELSRRDDVASILEAKANDKYWSDSVNEYILNLIEKSSDSNGN